MAHKEQHRGHQDKKKSKKIQTVEQVPGPHQNNIIEQINANEPHRVKP